MKRFLLSTVIASLFLPYEARGGSVASSIDVFVDGVFQSQRGSSISVSHNKSDVRFSVEHQAPRVRYRLSNFDSDWREPTGEMFFIVRFLKNNREQVFQQSFPAVGTSLGWKDSLEESLFTPRRETITIPEDAESFYVVISSAGPPTLVGIFAVSGVNIKSKATGNSRGVTYLRDSRIPGSTAKVWRKSGTQSAMASARNLDEGSTDSPLLIIKDDQIKAHADWNTGDFALQEVVPGAQLEVEWNEAYNAGIGATLSAAYDRLPIGSYSFEVQELSIEGTPVGNINRVSLTVQPPIWQRVWFWIAILGGIAVVGTLCGRYLIRKRIAQHLEKAQLISDERLRIARDLHDDLGTRLSHISLLSSFAQSSSRDPEVSSNFAQISSMSRELIGALSETVWMLNPKNNQLEALVDFLCRVVSELCRLANIRCRIDAMSVTENVMINHEFRHNMTLAVKEVVNNALKHSKAEEVTMSIRVEGKLLVVTLADNGIGIGQNASKAGVGLESIQQRMASILGTCTIQPLDSNGLRVSLCAPIH